MNRLNCFNEKIGRFVKKNKNGLIVIAIFLLFFLFYGVLNSYHKSARHECDPILYYQAAESIYYGRGMEHFGAPSSFLTFLYPLLISPFFAIQNVVLRIHLISLFNSVLMSSCIFPLYLLSKRILDNNRLRLVFVFVSMLLPFTTMVLEFMMVEVLYYPLLFWLIYMLYININKKNYFISGFGGFLTAATLFCKYIILCFFFAVIFLPFVLCLIDRIMNKKWSPNRFLSKAVILNLTVYAISFLTPFLLIKYAIFKNFDPLVHSLFTRFSTFGHVAYFLYGFVHILCAMAICSLIIPFVFPWFCFRKMKRELSYFYILIILFFLIMAAVISYLIYINEDYEWVAPRPLSRYYMECTPLLFLFLFSLYENKKIYLDSNNSPKIKHAIILTSFFICLFFKGVGTQTNCEGFYIYGAIESNLINSGHDGFLRYFVVFCFTAFLCSLFYGLYLLLISDKKIRIGETKIKLKIFGLISLSLCISSTLHGFVLYRKDIAVPEATIQAANNINVFLDAHRNSKVLIINRYDRVLGIYLQHNDNVMPIKRDKFESDITSMQLTTVTIGSIQFYSPRYNFPYKKVDRIDYVFFQNGVSVEFKNFKMEGVTQVDFDGLDCWYLFKNDNPSTFHFTFNDFS